MIVTKDYLEERHAYWVKRIGDAGIWDATLFKPVTMEVKKKSKIYRGRFIRRWIKVSSTQMNLEDTIVIYQQYRDMSEKDINNTLVCLMITQYLQQNDLEDFGCHKGPLFHELKNKINKAFRKEIYIEGL